MDIELIEKVDELISIFDNSKEIERLRYLKDKIHKDKLLKDKLDYYKSLNIYDKDYLKIKKEILDIDIVKEYKALENDLFLLTLDISKNFKSLTNKKGCFHENN